MRTRNELKAIRYDGTSWSGEFVTLMLDSSSKMILHVQREVNRDCEVMSPVSTGLTDRFKLLKLYSASSVSSTLATSLSSESCICSFGSLQLICNHLYQQLQVPRHTSRHERNFRNIMDLHWSPRIIKG